MESSVRCRYRRVLAFLSRSLILFPNKVAQIGGHRTLQGRQMSAVLSESGAEQDLGLVGLSMRGGFWNDDEYSIQNNH